MATTRHDASTTTRYAGDLSGLGVSPVEQRAFQSLLRAGSSTLGELAAALDGVHPATVRRLAARLVEMGLAIRLPGRPARLVAAPPRAAVENLAARRQDELNQSRLAATALIEEATYGADHRPDQLLELVTGGHEVAERYKTLHRLARQEVLCLVRAPYTLDPDDPITHEEISMARGAVVRTIYAREVLDQPGMPERMQRSIAAGERARMGDVPLKLFIADRDTAILPLTVGGVVDSALLVHRSALLDALVALFETLWRAAVPYALEPVGHHWDERERQILLLLATGATDENIARQLGISPRTVQRHVRSLCDDLGAVTRFQAGLKVGRGSHSVVLGIDH